VRRRAVITLLGGAAVWPSLAQAQPVTPPRRIGVLIGLAEGDAEGRRWADALLRRLRELGWTEDRTIRIDLRFAGSDPN
jgi:hypothetical protein